MKKSYICIGCPLGCRLEVEIQNGDIRVSGNKCPIGERWVKEEIKNPMRTLITVLPVKNSNIPTVSVKSDRPVPRDKIPEILELLANMELSAPISAGDVILENPLGIQAKIIATRDAKTKNSGK